MSDEQTPDTQSAARWQPLEKIDRRVVGVLVEKAKTTPENYPLSLNSLTNGCNQKSNRSPQMQLDEAQVEEAIDRLRAVGALSLIQGDGRVDKYRHLLYDWLGVDKAELAVMSELLLRGAQTLGDLRSRAARMEPIPGIVELRPIVESLRQKGLLLLLTPPGRGCVVTHALYHEQELTKLRAEYGNADTNAPVAAASPVQPQREPTPPTDDECQALREEVAALREQFETEIGRLRSELESLNRQPGVGPVA